MDAGSASAGHKSDLEATSNIAAGSASAGHKAELEAAREAALTARSDELEWPAQAAELAHWESARENKVRTPNKKKYCLCCACACTPGCCRTCLPSGGHACTADANTAAQPAVAAGAASRAVCMQQVQDRLLRHVLAQTRLC